MSNEIRNRINEILEHSGVRFSAIYMGEKKNAFDGAYAMDNWSCMFERIESTRELIEFDFFTGISHRKPPDRLPLGHPQTGCNRRTVDVALEKLAKPQAPHPADLLYSLISDAEACDMSFGTWCDELGYDTDSRKALETYEACQRNGDKLRRFFARETLEALTNALQDY